MSNVPAGLTIAGQFEQCVEAAGRALEAELYRLLLAPPDAPPHHTAPMIGDPRLAAWAGGVLWPIQEWVIITSSLVAHMHANGDTNGPWTDLPIAEPAFVRRVRREVVNGDREFDRTGEWRPGLTDRELQIRMLWSVDINAASHGILFGLHVSSSWFETWRNPYTSLCWWDVVVPVPPGIDVARGFGPPGRNAEATWPAASEHPMGAPLVSPRVFLSPNAARERLRSWQLQNGANDRLTRARRYPAWWDGIDRPGPAAHAPGRVCSSHVSWPAVPSPAYVL